MSSELRGAIKDAAPAPATDLDTPAVAARARRMTVARGVALITATALAAGGLSLATRDAGSSVDIADHGDRAPEVPGGPRYEIASGRYGDDWKTDPGSEWRFLVWGDGHTQCWQLATGEDPDRQGLSCSAPSRGQTLEEEALGGSYSFYTGSEDPTEFFFMAGVLSPRVAALEFHPDRRESVPIDILDPPSGSTATMRYYVATLPAFAEADLVARGADGDVLETRHICGPACQEERDRREAAEVAHYEAEPVNAQSRAAAFANLAAGHAGLVDSLAIHYVYQQLTRSDDAFRAHFDVFDCDPPSGPDGSYRCARRLGEAFIDVAREGQRLVVRDAQGPMTRQQRIDLLEYSLPASEFGPRWRQSSFSATREQDRRDWALSYSIVWMGNLPAPVDDYGSLCVGTLYDERGDVLIEWRPQMMIVPDTARPPVVTATTGLEPEFGRPAELVLECDDPRPGVMEDLRG